MVGYGGKVGLAGEVREATYCVVREGEWKVREMG